MGAAANNRLLFSIDKEIAFPASEAGKVWRVYIVSGTLCLGDSIRITAARLKGKPRSELCDVMAEVKAIHEELDATEEMREAGAAAKGSIVGLDIKNCYCGRRRVPKKEISFTKQSIGLSSGEPFEELDTFTVRFSSPEEAIGAVKVGRNAILLWFGKSVSGKVVEIFDSLEGMRVCLLFGKRLAIPSDSALRTEVVRCTKVFVDYKGKVCYINAFLEFEEGGDD